MSRDEDFWLDEIQIDESLATEPIGPAANGSKDRHQPAAEEELADGRRYMDSMGEAALPKESLITLTDWERYLVPQVRQVEILGEIPLTQEDGQKLGRLFGQLFEQKGMMRSDRLILSAYRASFAAFLVVQGVYGYKEGEYWPGVSQATGQDLDANWKPRLGQLFETIVRTLGLNTFPDYPPGALRFLSRILGHGGIPNACLDDYFERMLKPAITQASYANLESWEVMAEWLDRLKRKSILVDVPVQRFIEFGGRLAEDFVERTLEMGRVYWTEDRVPPAEEIGLPPHTVAAFAAWAERSGPTGLPQDALRLRRPELVLDPWGEGITLYLPSQPIPAKYSLAHISWEIVAGGSDASRSFPAGDRAGSSLPSRVRPVGAEWRSVDHSLQLKRPANLITVSFLIDGERERQWTYYGPDEDFPLLTFDVETYILRRRRPYLPARELWLLYPRQLHLEAEPGLARLCEETPRLGWGWADFACQRWDLSQAASLRLADSAGKTILALPVRADESVQRPSLVGGERFSLGAPGLPSPLYLDTPPLIHIPLVGRSSLVEELGRWRVTVQSQGPAQPNLKKAFLLSDYRPQLVTGEGHVDLPLDSPNLLGQRPYGCFEVRLRGPLGRDAQFAFRVLPHLSVRGHDMCRMPDKQGPLAATLEIETGIDIYIKPRGPEADYRLDGLTRQATRWIHKIYAGPETTLVEVDVVKPATPGSQEVRVPLSIPVHRLRWALEDEGSELPLSELLHGQVIGQPIESWLQARSPALMVELPGVGAQTISLTLLLLDGEGHELQRASLAAARPEQACWRFELSGFTDTLRHSDSPILRFELRITGLPDAPGGVSIPVMRLTQSLMVEAIAIIPTIQDEQVQLEMSWTAAHRLRNRFVRFWPLWQPWEEPFYQPIPDDALDGFVIHVDPAQLQLRPTKYRLELGIADPWSPPTQLQRPAPGAQNTLDVAFVPAEHRLQILDQKGRAQGAQFALVLEYAIIQRELGNQPAADQTVQWCYQNLDRATIPQMLAMVDHLGEIGHTEHLKITQLKLFAPARIQALLSASGQGMVGQDQIRRYLDSMPRAELLPTETAKLLLTVDDARAKMAALQRLIQQKEPSAITYILSSCKNGTMSEADAVSMLLPLGDLAVVELEKLKDEPVALRLMARLPGMLTVKVGDWVRSLAGWGRIERIVRLSDEKVVECFLRREAGFRLHVALRPQHDAAPVTVEVVKDFYRLQFEKASKVYRCTKSENCCFITPNADLLCEGHNRALHGGKGPQFFVENKSLFRCIKSLEYSARAPRDMLT